MPDPVARLNAALSGRYRIERQLGEGGMATVYLAEDLRHHRNVALKVLKPELAAVVGSERFLAEIRTTANLQHPHILPLFDSGDAEGLLFYVMPHVEGESLRARLDREHQLPVDEAVRIATNVAEALDYAHRRGVIHRDIKPANILLLDGKPVIADFGIALAVSAGGAGRLTETGLSLGTPHYMSPEQATGDQTVGPATDIWALGCVLYEMLVGEPPYTGSTPQAVLGKIITAEPASITGSRRTVPSNVEAAVRKALEKVPADRFGTAETLARMLGDPTFRHGERAPAAHRRGARFWKQTAAVGWAVAGLFALGLAWTFLRPAYERTSGPVARFAVAVGEGAEVYLGGVRDAVWGRPSRTSLAISPDGELLVYSAWERSGGGIESRLYARRLGQQRADPILGTDGGSSPFFSPDGAWIGFFAGAALMRIPVAGGDPETLVTDLRLAERDGPMGASWGSDGTIALALADGGLYRLPSGGGTLEPVVMPTPAAIGFPRYAQPFWLPGSDALLYHVLPSPDAEGAEIRSVDLATLEHATVLYDALDPRYVSTGHLLFVRRGTLMAVRFDAERLEILGEPVTVLADVMHALDAYNPSHTTGAAQIAVSDAGHLIYARGGAFPEAAARAVRLWRSGEVEELEIDPRRFQRFRVSPLGNRIAFSAGVAGSSAIYVHDLDSDVTSVLNTGGSFSDKQEWSADGLSLVFSSNRDTPARNIYRVRLAEGAAPERLAPSNEEQQMLSWASHGAIAFGRDSDIWILTPGGEPEAFVTSSAREDEATFSPDGRWLMYTSDFSGREEVYVRPFPGPGPSVQVSRDGGENPAWSTDGSEIFYLERGPEGLAMMAVDVSLSDGIRAGRPAPVMDPWPAGSWTNNRGYDVLADGSFVAAVLVADSASGATNTRDRLRGSELHVVLNFFAELRARVPN